MKPVIKKQTHYNVLFMRDDGAAKTYRVRGGVLRFLFIFPIVLTLLSAGVIAAGVHFGKDYLDMRNRSGQQEKEISEMRLQLERLTNLETLLSASSASGAVPLAKHEEVVAPAPEKTNANSNATQTQYAAIGVPPQANATTAEPDKTAEAVTNSTAQTSPGTDGSASTAEGSAAAAVSLPGLSSEQSPVRISNFSARPIGQQRVRIRYEISVSPNQDGKMLSGMARTFAVFNDGQRLELPTLDNSEIRFAITRMKPMEATARLPQGYETGDIKNIDLVIVVEDNGSYHDLFELTQWRAY
jgi:hypothetical protein